MAKKRDSVQRFQLEHWSKDKHARRKPDHRVVHAVFDRLSDIVASSIENPRNSSVLDVGCGNGFLQWALEKRFGAIAGLDYSRQMLEVNPCKEKYLGSCTNLPFKDNSFDVAVSANLLHHLTEPERIQSLLEMRRVAKRTVVSFEPNRNNPFMFAFSLIRPEERMALMFTSSYMRNLFNRAGLAGVHVHVEGWIVPNKAPVWYIPIGHTLGRTPFRMFGFDICTVGNVKK